jgi:hypothetical protein
MAPAFRAVETGTSLPWRGLDPFPQGVKALRALRRLGGWKAYDAVLWLRPQDQRTMLYVRSLLAQLPASMPLVVGPVSPPWPRDLK